MQVSHPGEDQSGTPKGRTVPEVDSIRSPRTPRVTEDLPASWACLTSACLPLPQLVLPSPPLPQAPPGGQALDRLWAEAFSSGSLSSGSWVGASGPDLSSGLVVSW